MSEFLSEMGVDELASTPTQSSVDPLLSFFLQCLESAKGIEVDAGSEDAARGLRFKLYRRRVAFQKAGSRSIDGVTIKVKGSIVTLLPPVDFIVREL